MNSALATPLLDAIYGRRAIRRYTARTVDADAIAQLIDAAIQAPSAMDEQPWAFVVIRGADRLASYSDRIKQHLLAAPGAIGEAANRLLSREDISVFHNAPVLAVVCATADEQQAMEDCSLAAQNFMLAAYASGLGTCPIGFARPWLRLPETKREIGIPEGLIPTFPIALGFPDERPQRPERRAPRVIYVSD